jgi:hypothetical protein
MSIQNGVIVHNDLRKLLCMIEEPSKIGRYTKKGTNLVTGCHIND